MTALTTKSTNIEALRPLLAEAQAKCDELLAAETALSDGLYNLCVHMWELGKLLALLKESVGHGRWMFFVAANFQKLGKDEQSRVRRANEAKAFFEANPNWQVPANFTTESIRKCVFRMAPDKERPKLAGDQAVPPLRGHHLKIVNDIVTWTHHLEEGLKTKPEIEVLRQDFREPFRSLVSALGVEWAREQVEELLA